MWSYGLLLLLLIVVEETIAANENNSTTVLDEVVAVRHYFDILCPSTSATSAQLVVKSANDEQATVLCSLFDPGNELIYQQYWTDQMFMTDIEQTYICEWPSTTLLSSGNYVIKAGIFSSDWQINYQWIESACTYTYTVPASATPSFTVVGSVSSTNVRVGDTVVLSATVTSDTGPLDILIDLEIYDTTGKQKFQWYQDNQRIEARTPQLWTAKWVVPASNIAVGMTLNFDIGIFEPKWGSQYVWKNSVASFTIIAPPSSTPPPTGSIVTHTVAIVNNQVCDVYSWPDSKGLTRTVALKQEGSGNAGHGGYAVQMTYKVASTGRLVTVNWDARGGDKGFGYFVSHERYRSFVSGPDGTIASRVFGGETDSPLGNNFPVTGQVLIPTSSSSAAHRFTTSYPRYGTVTPVRKNAYGVDERRLSLNKVDYKKYWTTLNITWVFEAGNDYPRIDTSIDLSDIGEPDLVNMDLRGPYGVLIFDDGINGPVTNVQWGDRFHFVVTQTPVTRASGWTWNTPNYGARYQALIAGQYEMGLFEPKVYSESILADDGNPVRGQTSTSYNGGRGGCAGQILPCDYQWPYQSIQYSLPLQGVAHFKKIAWGSTAYYGTGATMTSISDTINFKQPFNGWPADKLLRYDLCVVLGLTIPDGLTKTAAVSKASFNCATSVYA